MPDQFSTFLEQHQRRIHFHIRNLNVSEDNYDAYYAEGILALWYGYNHQKEQTENVGTFLNHHIRYRLIDLARDFVRKQKNEEVIFREECLNQDDGNRYGTTNQYLQAYSEIIVEQSEIWDDIKDKLTTKQWKWVEYFVIANLSVQEIMDIEQVSQETVKGWARAARRKLKHEHLRTKLAKLIEVE